MSLSPLTPRCEGMHARFLGQRTTASQCYDCERLTDRPPMDHSRIVWMTPPKGGLCFQKLYPDDGVETVQ